MIRNRAREVCDRLEKSIKDVSEGSGVNRSVVGRLCRNEVDRVDFGTLDAICRYLNVTVGDLLEYVPDEDLSQEDIEHLMVRDKYLKRKSEYWQRYKKENAPSE